MIDLTIRPGAQSRDAVLQVVHETFDRVVDPPEEGEEPPVLDDAFLLARAAFERNDVPAVDLYLRELIVAAIHGRARLRMEYPELAGVA